MSARRGASGLSGILLVDKPQGLTSHDVVNRIRRLTGERRVGHAGTLDPMATGLLVLLVGPATRLAPYLTTAEKTYTARIAFGTETDTDDAEGEVVRTAAVPPAALDGRKAAEITAQLVGRHEQVPPTYSAVKRDGVTAYAAARKGEAFEMAPRTVEVTNAQLIGIIEDPPAWDLELSVSKGTYIRAIARDLGRSLGSAAHLSALRRTRSGSLDVADANELSVLEAAGNPAEVAALFADPIGALGLPSTETTDEGAALVTHGSALAGTLHCTSSFPDSGLVSLCYKGALLAVYAVADGALRPQAVIPGGVRRGGQ